MQQPPVHVLISSTAKAKQLLISSLSHWLSVDHIQKNDTYFWNLSLLHLRISVPDDQNDSINTFKEWACYNKDILAAEYSHAVEKSRPKEYCNTVITYTVFSSVLPIHSLCVHLSSVYKALFTYFLSFKLQLSALVLSSLM